MADSLLLQKLGEHYRDNLERYVKEHPKEYVLIEEYDIETFYKSESEMKDGIYKKYGDSMSYTILGTQIPDKMPEKKDKSTVLSKRKP